MVFPFGRCFTRAMTHRFVVPSALVELLRAEQTTATRLSMRLGLVAKVSKDVLRGQGEVEVESSS
jgi:hypothetical protein